jgi:hypothetical protein
MSSDNVGGYQRFRTNLLPPAPLNIKPEDEITNFLRNVGIHIQRYTVLQSRRPQDELSRENLKIVSSNIRLYFQR